MDFRKEPQSPGPGLLDNNPPVCGKLSMGSGETNIDRLLKARAEIDEELRRHKIPLAVAFTDVVGSTAYFDRYGDTAGFAMLQHHARFAAKIFVEFQGRVIKTI